jgi:hypothetical protein
MNTVNFPEKETKTKHVVILPAVEIGMLDIVINKFIDENPHFEYKEHIGPLMGVSSKLAGAPAVILVHPIFKRVWKEEPR